MGEGMWRILGMGHEHRCFGWAVLLSLVAHAAAAQPASPLAILNVPTSQVPVGQTSALGLSAGFDSGGRIPVDLLAAVSGWSRVELGVVLPLRADASHVEVAPLRAAGKIVLVPRREAARGIGAALIVGTDLPLHDFDVMRFGVNLGLAADVQFARGILVAGYASAGASARYRLEDPAFQSFASGVGLRMPITERLDFLADLWGRVDVPGGATVTAGTSAGLGVHVGQVFVTGSAGTSFTDPSFLVRFTVQVGAGDGMLIPAERDDVEPPKDACFVTRCTRQQHAAVRRVLLPRIEALRAQLVMLAALVRERFPTRTDVAGQGSMVRLWIDNDLTIPDDLDRKRELSLRFLLAAFARHGIAIDRATANQLLDDTHWRVQVDRAIDEPRADYFTFDMPRLAAAYAARLRWNAERLADAMKALRAADAGTTEILLDIARGHANGLIGVTNGILDLPLAPINLARFALDRPSIHGLGRIPHLEYKSDWGRRFGGAVELGVAIGTMMKPGREIFAGLGRAAAPAVERLGAELALLEWNGLPIGRFLQTILSRWMQGSVFAVKSHAAAEAGELLVALLTKQVRNPDGTYRPMTADDLDEILQSLIGDFATLWATMATEEGLREGEKPGTFLTGRLSERVLLRLLEKKGFKKVLPIQNGSGHGIDLVVDEPVLAIDYTGGKPFFIEIKASTTDKVPGLSEAQRDIEHFVEKRLKAAADGKEQWSNVSPAVQAEADRLLKLHEAGKLQIRGKVIGIIRVGTPDVQIFSDKW